jgi:hypothetical protein
MRRAIRALAALGLLAGAVVTAFAVARSGGRAKGAVTVFSGSSISGNVSWERSHSPVPTGSPKELRP